MQIAAGWIRHFGASRILDIGCGEGQLLTALDLTAVDSYVGLDVSSIATARAIKRPGALSQFRTIDVQSEDIPSDISTDCICCIDVLYYFEDPAAVLRKLFRTLLPGHPAVMGIAAHHNADLGPVTADVSDHMLEDGPHFPARGRLAFAQDHRRRLNAGSLVDVDRQEAAFVVVRVEQRQLLVTVHGIEGVVDIERDRGRRAAVNRSGFR